MKKPISLFWFRQDLRLSDNPGLMKASEFGAVLPIYILDNLAPDQFKIGNASKIYLHHSLTSLNKSLHGNLNIYIGNPEKIILQLIEKHSILNVFWNYCCEPWFIDNDNRIEKSLKLKNFNCTIFNGSYLWQPEEIKKRDNTYYKIFSHYKKQAFFIQPRKSIPKPENLITIKDTTNKTTLVDLKLISNNELNKKITEQWTFGESGAFDKLQYFLKNSLSEYTKNKDYPKNNQTSKLSVNLHFGEISPNQIWDSIINIKSINVTQDNKEHFLSEITWREFSSYLMKHFNTLHVDNFKNKFNSFPWENNLIHLHAWQEGNTGYPIVDAGMRELKKTGYMHNRVRMIVASFLVKNLMIHWHYGENWFWNYLVDADLGNNSNNWQWVAGSGVDTAPYFRIFNPITQGEKFDKYGDYTKKFIPELKNLPNKYLFKPWTAPEEILQQAGIILGINYPKPIINLNISRKKALIAYKNLLKK